MTSILDKITMIGFPASQYLNTAFKKTQLFLHHTASSGNPFDVKDWWLSNTERVGTPFILARGDGQNYKDGDIIQLFLSNRGIWHLGLKASDLIPGGKTSTELNMNSIGIELANWGGLTHKDGKFFHYDGGIVPEADVIELATPYRGFKYFQSYTLAQLENLRNLLLVLGNKYSIPTKWIGMEMFDINPRCLKGESAIWAHVSCRKDKFDVFPDPNLIKMLESL
jgi:N-acetyl-anhydromuramyl-L-alanine amidase AmpD